jgi:transcriptional regulator of acetoin/glycerol metabolism
MADPKDEAADAAARDQQKTVEWIDRNMATHFANVVNVQSTREQVDLFFGTNQTWNISSEPKLAVDLSNRVILTPHAAKRLWAVLGGVLREYEQRYGVLTVDRS